MYSFSALPDTSQTHIGFYLMCALCAVILLALVREWVASKEGGALVVIASVFGVFMLGIGYLCSYAPAPKNVQVIAAFEGFAPEVSSRQSGKTTVTEHLLYGQFRVPEGVVALQVQKGAAIAPRVVLYKN